MSEESHVDGNALGGMLFELFGRDMTGRLGCCGHCGAINALGTVLVYSRAPGDVLRCPACSNVLVVITRIESRVRVGFEGLRWVEPMAG